MTTHEDLAERWVRALSAHDLGAAAACFHADYRDEAPARRGETVEGREQVRDNFASLLRDVPDLQAELLNTASQADRLWMEWRMSGTRADGTLMEFVGVNIFEVEDGQFLRGRIYTELVRDAGGVQAQLERMTGREG